MDMVSYLVSSLSVLKWLSIKQTEYWWCVNERNVDEQYPISGLCHELLSGWCSRTRPSGNHPADRLPCGRSAHSAKSAAVELSLALMLDIAEELLLLSWSISSPIFHLSWETPSEASDGGAQRGSMQRCQPHGRTAWIALRVARGTSSFKGTYSTPISTANKHDVFSRNLFLHWFFSQACIHASYYIDTYTLTDTSVTSLFKGITSRNRKMHLY